MGGIEVQEDLARGTLGTVCVCVREGVCVCVCVCMHACM